MLPLRHDDAAERGPFIAGHLAISMPPSFDAIEISATRFQLGAGPSRFTLLTMAPPRDVRRREEIEAGL